MNVNNCLDREERLIQTVDTILNEFFEIRNQFVWNLNNQYIQDCVSDANQFLGCLNLLNVDIEGLWNCLMKEIQIIQNRNINFNFYKEYTSIEKISNDFYSEDLNETMTESFRTEMIAKICSVVINQSIYRMMDFAFNGNRFKHIGEQCDYADKLLNCYSTSRLTETNYRRIQEQLIGILCNIKMEIRNKFIQFVLLENQIFTRDYESAISA